jgi:penicillin amidase
MKTAWEIRPRFLAAALSGSGKVAEWCDDVTTPGKETCQERVTQALKRALDDLEKRLGKNQSLWRWGDLHAARSAHRPLSAVPYLGRIFDIRVPTGGDAYTVNVGRYNIRNDAEPFVSTHAASLRAVYDLADLENSRFIHSSGQSGHPLSGRYRNFAERWARTEFIPMRTERRSVEKGALGTLKLRP